MNFSNLTFYFKAFLPQFTQPVRFRYWSEMQAKGPIKYRRRGYNDSKLFKGGLLPRIPHNKKKLPMPIYKPQTAWNQYKAVYGQNDFIDILGGNKKIHPVNLQYNIPSWLRGAKGNEFQLLLRKEKMLGPGKLPKSRPRHWREIKMRINYLYKYLLRRQRVGMPPKSV